jgi:hypothetical protein
VDTATGLLDRFCIGENITVMRNIFGATSKKIKRKHILEIHV